MNASGGGVTASGGEAILQAEFVRDWFRACHAEGINTCGHQWLRAPLRSGDRRAAGHHRSGDAGPETDERRDPPEPVGVSNHRTLEFARYGETQPAHWIRYVVVPGWSDDDKSAHLLGEFTKDMTNIEKIELLPYHELGKHKWVAMGKSTSWTAFIRRRPRPWIASKASRKATATKSFTDWRSAKNRLMAGFMLRRQRTACDGDPASASSAASAGKPAPRQRSSRTARDRVVLHQQRRHRRAQQAADGVAHQQRTVHRHQLVR